MVEINSLVKFNNENNFTGFYCSQDHLVIRRGFQWHLIVNLSSLPFHIKPKDVTLELCRGDIASFACGTKYQGVYTEKIQSTLRQHQWKMEVCRLHGMTSKPQYTVEPL